MSTNCVLNCSVYPTVCDPMDCSTPGSTFHGIFQARILEWVAVSYSRGSSQPRDWTPDLPNFRQILFHLSHQGSWCVRMSVYRGTGKMTGPSSWTYLVLISLCHVLRLCHSFKCSALPPPLLFWLSWWALALRPISQQPCLPGGVSGGSAGKESARNVGDLDWEDPLEKGSGLENSMDCIFHGITKSQTQLSDFHFTAFR